MILGKSTKLNLNLDVFSSSIVNSSAQHYLGRSASQSTTVARDKTIVFTCSQSILCYTSSATEALNLAIQGYQRRLGKKMFVVSSAMEHPAVRETLLALESMGLAEIAYFPNNSKGQVEPDQVQEMLEALIASGRKPDMLAMMAVNNETGNILPFCEVGEICEALGIDYLCDATQAIGKTPFNFEESRASFAALSAHKFYGPMGVGALLIREDCREKLAPLMFGGKQEYGLRPGTQNVPGIVAMAEALEDAVTNLEKYNQKIREMRDYLQNQLQQRIPELVVNGDLDNRLPHALHVSIPGIPNEAVLGRVSHQLAISRGSACASGIERPSHVLQAMNLPTELQESALRISLGKHNTMEEMDAAANILVEAVDAIRRLQTAA